MSTTMTATPTGMIPQQDTRVEAWLDERGVKYTYTPGLALSTIDMEASLRNQARVTVEPISQDFVGSYAQAMENGNTFPPIVVWESGKDTWTVIDGNHRVAAALQLGWDELPAYKVSTTDEKVITLLTYEANAKHGIPTTPGERIQQALHLIDAGVTGADASRLLGVGYSNLVNRHRSLRAKRHMNALGIDATGLGEGVINRLASIHNDRVLREAAELARKAGMKVGPVNDLVTRVNAERTEDAQMQVVRDEFDRRKGEIGQMAGFVRMPNSVRRWASVVGQVVALEMSQEDVDRLTDEYRKNLYERALDAQKRLDQLVKVLR